jgi:hypothetical protein
LNTDGARALAGCPRLAGLRELTLDDNRIGSRGAAALAASPFLTDLGLLSLCNNGIGNGGAKALAAGGWKRLRVVDLGANDITTAGVKALLTAPIGKHTSTLRLDGNRDGPEGKELRRRRRVRAWPTAGEGLK